eukprot:UN20377
MAAKDTCRFASTLLASLSFCLLLSNAVCTGGKTLVLLDNQFIKEPTLYFNFKRNGHQLTFKTADDPGLAT